jgi:hypothetical protein
MIFCQSFKMFLLLFHLLMLKKLNSVNTNSVNFRNGSKYNVLNMENGLQKFERWKFELERRSI